MGGRGVVLSRLISASFGCRVFAVPPALLCVSSKSLRKYPTNKYRSVLAMFNFNFHSAFQKQCVHVQFVREYNQN